MVVTLELFVVNIERPVSEKQYLKWIDIIGEQQKDRILRFHFKDDAKRTLFGDILIRYLACQKLHILNKDIIIKRNIYGKPYIKGVDKFHYNISHAGKWVVCVLSDRPVGIDIEIILPIDLEIARNFFTESEYISIRKLPQKDQLAGFYRFWTAKESYIKYIGKGLSIPLNSFTVLKKAEESYTVDIDKSCLIKTAEFLGGGILSICHSVQSTERMLLEEIFMDKINI